MILTDGVTTFTDTKAQETADPLWNSSQVITIGGVVKQQADSARLRITSKHRLTQTQLTALNSILANFTQSLTYTPGRKLYNRSTAAAMTVTAEAPVIEERSYDGEMVYYVTCTYEEVIG
jgi:hypothetical protein